MKNLVRFAIVLSTVAMTAACAGTAPTSPSAGLTASAGAAASTDAKGGSTSGLASLALYNGPTADYPSGYLSIAKVPGGRLVTLYGDIAGTNFEPGECIGTGPDFTPGLPSFCVAFGTADGQFVRERAGGTAFTTCECTIGGRTGTVTLKISYPPPTTPNYPGGFTKFTFQDGRNGLEGLTGQGTLDFSKGTDQVTFTYRFAGRS